MWATPSTISLSPARTPVIQLTRLLPRGPQKQIPALTLLCLAQRSRGAEEGGKVAEGYGGFLKTEMHLNSDLFSGLSQREGANCPEEGTDT